MFPQIGLLALQIVNNVLIIGYFIARKHSSHMLLEMLEFFIAVLCVQLVFGLAFPGGFSVDFYLEMELVGVVVGGRPVGECKG